MKLEYRCVCGSELTVTTRRYTTELAAAWTQHAACPALWARLGPVDQTAQTIELSPWVVPASGESHTPEEPPRK